MGAAPTAVGNPPVHKFDTEEFFEKVVSMVPGIVYVFNHETNANEYSNRSIATLLDYSSAEIIAMGDALLQNIIHPEDLNGLIAYFASIGSMQDDALAHFEYRIHARDGSVLWLRTVDAVFERNSDGSVLRHIGVATDATEQIEQRLELARMNLSLENNITRRTRQLANLNATLEQKVQDRTGELLKINEELEQLTYIATHDLKVPVTNLTHLTQIFADDTSGLTTEQRDVVGWMAQSCAQASDKIGGMVEVAHARSAELKPMQRVDLTKIAQTSCALLAHEIKACNATVTLDFGAVQWASYPPFETASIFDNLIGNALKYAHPDRAAQIHLHTQMQGHQVLLTIRDNGTGLNLPYDKDKVFGLFKRAHVTPSGAGIALYTIRKMLERYGGGINVDSALGEWTEFQITLPKYPFPQPEEDT